MEYTSKEVYEYISKRTNDPIVEWKKCCVSGQEFPIYQSDLEFYDKVSPTFEVDENYVKDFFERNNDVKDYFEYKGGKLKAKLPTPTLCPEERCRKRYAFRNENNLYKRKDDFSGKDIVSIYSPDKPYKVYEKNIWRGDNWDSMESGVNLGENFCKDFGTVLLNTPVINSFIVDNDNDGNSIYTNHIMNPKNSYLCFNSINIENCMYIREGERAKYCVNCDYVINCENCHDCVWCFDSYDMKTSQYCSNCSFCEYCENCTNCHYCINCSNLENKSYYINNVQYTKEEYELLALRTKRELKQSEFVVGCSQTGCERCFGNDLKNCCDSSFITESYDCNNVKYINRQLQLKDCMDLQGSCEQYTLEGISSANSYLGGFMSYGSGNKESRYYIYCYNCSNIFGCVGLKHKEYCIYNKQYSKEEYNQTVPQIIAQMIRDKEWGEFFNPQLSYYGYNESIAMIYYPLTKQEALKRGFKRSDYEIPAPKVEKFVPGDKLPKIGCKTIQEKKPDFLKKILDYAIVCEVTKKPFRLLKQEIDFYIKHDLPLPTKHPDVRHAERLARKNPTTMHLIHCDKCGKEMLSVHLPGEGKKVLCEKCFYNEK